MADDHEFFDQIIAAMVGIREVVIAGPGTAKVAFETHLRERNAGVAEHVVGIETLDHPTDPELLAHARHHFAAIDQLGLD